MKSSTEIGSRKARCEPWRPALHEFSIVCLVLGLVAFCLKVGNTLSTSHELWNQNASKGYLREPACQPSVHNYSGLRNEVRSNLG